MEYIASYICPQIPSNVNFDILRMPPKFKWSMSSFVLLSMVNASLKLQPI